MLKISSVFAIAIACLALSSGTTSAGGIASIEEKIVYQCRGDQSAGGGFDICSVNPDGTGYQHLTHDSTEDSAPRISPDGQSIVWRRDITDLWIMDSDGSDQFELLPDINSAFGPPTWSPDGQTIAFICSDPDDPNVDGICLTDRIGSDFDMVWIIDPRPTYIEWSPVNPDLILVEVADGANEDIHILSLEDLSRTNITQTPSDYEHGTWSPDGTQIAFVGSPLPADGVSLVSLYTIDPDGTNRELLFTSDWSAPATHPAWSPRGDQIAYFCSHTDVGIAEVCIVDAQSGTLDDLLQEGVTDQYYLGKSPDWGYTGGSIFGDVNCDGVIDMQDADVLLKHLGGVLPAEDEPCIVIGTELTISGLIASYLWGDLNCDHVVDGHDALVVLWFLVGILNVSPPCPNMGTVAPFLVN